VLTVYNNCASEPGRYTKLLWRKQTRGVNIEDEGI